MGSSSSAATMEEQEPSSQQDEDFSVHVLASDLGIDARPFLSPSERTTIEVEENWQDCPSYLPDTNEDFSDLDALQILRVEGSDKSGNQIVRIVGKFFPGRTSYLIASIQLEQWKINQR